MRLTHQRTKTLLTLDFGLLSHEIDHISTSTFMHLQTAFLMVNEQCWCDLASKLMKNLMKNK